VGLDARVGSLSRSNSDYVASTQEDRLTARNVVVATGRFQVPFTPKVASGFDGSVYQIHAASYRNPASLPGHSVLVVGGGNSGFQIAAELARTRNVTLAVADKM